MTEALLAVPDIGRAHRERALTAVPTPVPGVRRVAVDTPAKQVRVEYDPAPTTAKAGGGA